ncbi:hypothetical protein HU200_045040 [Digitaria exilis]|uniref:FBD domain-containing protein n=1 Tax=Digitaria exilis TaxID=1010633 RepID=A0A835BBT5_9POAL|nr:hypothetical protein HU200_045040 [Digitaria exilis]
MRGLRAACATNRSWIQHAAAWGSPVAGLRPAAAPTATTTAPTASAPSPTTCCSRSSPASAAPAPPRAPAGSLSPVARARTPDLTFHDIAPEPLHAALTQVARPAGYLKIESPIHHKLSLAAISEMLHATAPLAPADLNVEIWGDDNLDGVERSFEQEMSRIPVRNISGLELELATKGHVYGAMLLDLLGLCSSIQKLQVTLNQYDQQVVKTCPVDCPCDLPNNWRSQIISLTDLKEVTIEGSKGEEHEVGLLKVLLRSAAMLETVTINFSSYVLQRCSPYMELPSILMAHPSVKFKIYSSCGDQVLFC